MEITKKAAAPATTDLKPVTNVVYVPLDRLANHVQVKNRQHETEDVSDLTADIERNGLDTPVMVWDGGKPGNLMKLGGETVPATFLIAGFRRREALRRFRSEDPKNFAKKFPNGIPAILRTGELQDVLCLHLRENIARVNPAAEDIIPVLLRLQDEFKMKQNAIAAQVGKSTAWVSQILTVKKTLGDEGIKELEKGGLSLKDAKDAAAKVKAAAKKGETLDPKEALKTAKAKTSARKDSGRERDEKRMSAKKVFAIYKAMPSVTMGERIQLLEKALGYLAGAEESLPKAFRLDSERVSKAKK